MLRALGLGDALTGVPALRGIRRAFPGAHLVLACPRAVGSLLREHGVVDDVLAVSGLALLAPDALVRAVDEAPVGLRERLRSGIDVGVNLHGNGPQSAAALAALCPGRVIAFASAVHPAGAVHDAGEHEVDRWCRLVSGAAAPCTPGDLVLPALAALGGERAGTVGVHPGAASASRRWPVERWSAVAEHLESRGRRVLVTGTPAAGRLCAAVSRRAGEDWCGRVDLPGLAELVARAALLVCGDTGVAHLATAARTPSVLLFGPTPPSRWGPTIDAERHTVLWPPATPREPGAGAGDPHAEALDPTLARTTVDDVLTAASALLAAG